MPNSHPWPSKAEQQSQVEMMTKVENKMEFVDSQGRVVPTDMIRKMQADRKMWGEYADILYGLQKDYEHAGFFESAEHTRKNREDILTILGLKMSEVDVDAQTLALVATMSRDALVRALKRLNLTERVGIFQERVFVSYERWGEEDLRQAVRGRLATGALKAEDLE